MANRWAGVIAVAGAGWLALSLWPASAAAAASGWTMERTPNPSGAKSAFLAGVSCPSARVCIAVGGSQPRSGPGTILAERWNGTGWTIQRTPRPNTPRSLSFAGVSCASPRDCIAVGSFETRTGGGTTLAARWNGTRWTIQRTPNPPGASSARLRAVSCPSPRLCIAVGSFDRIGRAGGTLAERWDGTRWTIQRLPASAFGSGLAAVSCPSRTACVAVGGIAPAFGPEAPLALRWNGTTWGVQRVPGTLPFSLLGVSCTAGNACTAVGHPGTRAARWNGTRWTAQRIPQPRGAEDSQLYGDSCASRTSCTAVGSYFVSHVRALAARWTGARWTIQRPPTPSGAKSAGLSGVSCPSPTLCLAVGSFETRTNLGRTLAERYSLQLRG